MITRLQILVVLIAHIFATNSSTNDRLLCSQNDTIRLPSPLSRVNTESILLSLRNQIRIYNSENTQTTIDAIYVTSTDEYQNEFVADHNKRLQYISGFSGSNGEAIITLDKAVFWTDGRYYRQADEELDCNWELMKSEFSNYLSKPNWLLSEFPNGANIWADPKLISSDDWITFEDELQELNENFILVKGSQNLIDQVWVNRNDTINTNELDAYIVSESFTGQNAPDKVKVVREKLSSLEVEAIIVTTLDEVAWVLNIRGGDVPYAKLLEAYLIISLTDVILYTDLNKVQNISLYFSAKHPNFLTIAPYQDFWTNFENISANWKQVLVPAAGTFNQGASKKVFDLVPAEKRLFQKSPIIDMKAVKNSVEILGMEAAQIRDSVAMCQFFHYLDENYALEKESWDELRVAKVLYDFRSRQKLFIGLSFPTIAGFGPHGALPHYMANNFTSSMLNDNSTLVIDSGGQYYDGTIDTTRTIHLGIPTDEHKEAYTRVLMGCIQLSSLVFPDTLPVNNMDVLTRSALWEIGYDFNHGTGHTVGASLNVHEDPIVIYYASTRESLLEPGYFFSIEPGLYLENNFGVRLENVVKVIVKKDLKYNTSSKRYLGLEDVTLVPYAKNLIDLDLLNKNHIRWLNKYNERIRNLVGSELLSQNLSSTYQWLLKNTEPISV